MLRVVNASLTVLLAGRGEVGWKVGRGLTLSPLGASVQLNHRSSMRARMTLHPWTRVVRADVEEGRATNQKDGVVWAVRERQLERVVSRMTDRATAT